MDWILAIKTDENATLKRLYSLYQNPCIKWLQQEFNCSKDDCVDIFQVSLVILYDNVMTGKLSHLTSNVQTYLYGIAKNKALELIRTQKKSIPLDTTSLWSDYVSTEYDDNEDIEYFLSVTSNALDTLGDPCKRLLIHFYYDDKSMEEITEIMSYKNADTTKNQKYKCLKRLQKLFSEHIIKSESL